jgi:DNA-binding SARP family transcriptional activator/tetratricopeptide (TPR) repeat protein
VSDGGGLEIGLLGEFAASYGGVQLDLGGPRQRAVLAMLVVHRGQTVSAEQIIECLWEDERPASAFAGLQSYVSHLRRRLEPDVAARSRSGVIARQARGYAVRLSPDAVDAWRFEQLLGAAEDADPVRRLTEALGLWRGAALADYADQAWAQPEITRLEELRSVARERLAAARVDLGEAAVMVGELEAMVAEAPLREERWRLLTLALYRAHRQADALGALRRARQTFADELGVDPGPALRTLEADVLAQSPALDARVERSAIIPAVPETAPDDDAVADLVERDRELSQLRQALAQLSLGRSTRLLVEGPAGIGKTRLLDELGRRAAERGVRVLAARGSPLERSFGYGVVRQLLEPAITDGLLCGAAAPARAVFDLASEHGEGSLAVLHALFSVTTQLAAETPLLIGVDNLQWADGPSLRYLAYLARRMAGMPAIVAATLRTGEADDIADLVAELAFDTDAVLLRPQPLSEEATSRLVARAFGRVAAPLFVAACHRTTNGNPLLLRQLLQALVAADVKPDAAHAHAVLAVGSRAVSSQVLLRLRRMPEECRRVARSVAVLGDAAQLPHVAALVGLSEPDTAAAIATLTRAEVLRDEDPLGFVHPIVAEAVYRDVPSAERGLDHERAAALLTGRGASAEQVAAHLLLAPTRGDQATVDVLRAAAGKAADRGATDSAVTYLRRALDEPPDSTVRPMVLLEVGRQEAQVDGRAGIEHLVAAYEHVTDPELQVRIATAIAQIQVFAGGRGAAVAFARDAARRLPAGSDDARDGLVALLRISGIMQSVDPALWRDTDIAEPTGPGVGAQMLRATLAWEAMLEGRDRDRSVRLARAALQDDRLWSADTGLLWCIAAAARMYADDDLGDFWLRSRTAAHARGSLFAVLSVNQWEGVWRWRKGELAEATTLIREAQEQDRMWGGSGVGLAYSYGALVAIELDRGAVADARQLVDAAPADARHGDGGRLLRLAAAGVLVAEGRYAQALAAVDEVADPVGIANPAWNPRRRLRAAALHGLGRTAEALPLLEEEVALLRGWGAPTSLGRSMTELGTISGRRETLAEAVAVLESSDAALLLSKARLALGEHPETSKGEAVALLRDAVDVAVACGSPGAAKQACGALRRLGQQPPAVPYHEPAPTATQQRVTALADRGMDVAEIAQALFLTPQTVHAALGELAVEGAR